MAGVSKLLKENEIVFRIGDPADSMYIVRKGTLKVYFLKGTEEIQLAILKEGAIVGEMAFFDAKPRSASVKALTTTEVTVISKADFDKLLTQVPKWMVSMMQSLVGRLRQTNEKLQEVEAQIAGRGASALILPNQKHPFQHVIRALRLIMLGIAKEGIKEGTMVLLARETITHLWSEIAGEDKELLDKIISCTEGTKFLIAKQDNAKNPILAFPNKGTFFHFIEYFSKYARSLKPLDPFLSEEALSLLGGLIAEAAASGYESINISLNNLKMQPSSKLLNIQNWAEAALELEKLNEFKVTKSTADTIFRVTTKEHKSVWNYLKLVKIYRDNSLM